jgi:hypothetical protein
MESIHGRRYHSTIGGRGGKYGTCGRRKRRKLLKPYGATAQAEEAGITVTANGRRRGRKLRKRQAA